MLTNFFTRGCASLGENSSTWTFSFLVHLLFRNSVYIGMLNSYEFLLTFFSSYHSYIVAEQLNFLLLQDYFIKKLFLSCKLLNKTSIIFGGVYLFNMSLLFL